MMRDFPDVVDLVFDKLDAQSVRRMLWVSSDTRRYARRHLQTEKGKDKDEHFSIKASLPPAVIAIPSSKEVYFGANPMVGQAFVHSMSPYLHDWPPTKLQVLQFIAGERDVDDYEEKAICLPFRCEKTVVGRYGHHFGCVVVEDENDCKPCNIIAFKAEADGNIVWQVNLCSGVPAAARKETAFCISKTGSLVAVAAVDGNCKLVRLADGRKVAESTFATGSLSTLTMGSENSRIVLAEDSGVPEYAKLTTFDDCTMGLKNSATLKTGQREDEYSASIDLVAGYAVQVLQGKRSLDLIAYSTADISVSSPVHLSDSFFFPDKQFVCGIADSPGSYLVEKILPEWRLLDGEYRGPNGGDKITPDEMEEKCSTRLFFIGYPRTIFLLWDLQDCKKDGRDIVCKAPKGFRV